MSAFLALPPEHRELVLRNSPRAYPLAEALTRRGYALRFHDLREMIAAGRLATAVAGRMTARQTGRSEAELRDLRACAWGVLGNGLRAQGKLDFAAAALGTAQEHLAAGTGRRHDVAALLLEFSASLRLGQGRCEEAQDLLARARKLRLALRDHHGAAKVRIQQGIATGRRGDPERAVRLLFEALHQVQDAPDLVRVGLQNLIYQLIAADSPSGRARCSRGCAACWRREGPSSN